MSKEAEDSVIKFERERRKAYTGLLEWLKSYAFFNDGVVDSLEKLTLSLGRLKKFFDDEPRRAEAGVLRKICDVLAINPKEMKDMISTIGRWQVRFKEIAEQVEQERRGQQKVLDRKLGL